MLSSQFLFIRKANPITSPRSPLRFRVTKVEHKANQKERRSLMSVSGAETVNGEVPATPVKRERSGTE